MKIFSFIQYFFYLGFNWTWTIAVYIIRQEYKGEKKYGLRTTGSDELKKLKAQGMDISHATVYMPINYFQLEEMFAVLPPDPRNHFLDIGCGKGRAVCVAAHYGYGKVTGIDFSKQFCIEAGENLQLTKEIIPSLEFSVIHNDAANVEIPADVDCIFLFNPFDMVIMKRVVANIEKSLQLNPRNLNVAYSNPLYKNLFFEKEFKEVYNKKQMNYLELSILNFRRP
ncbi:MAG: class I SAM-dependent methyltransferase [Ferruginibacter sp.]